jgi:hypothetical protein
MQDHEQVIEQRHHVRGVDVEKVDHHNHRENKQRSLPPLRMIFRVTNADEPLDDCTSQERT